METIYNRLYRLSVEHTFYKALACADLNFVPIGKSSTNLRVHGLIFKPFQTGFEIAFKAIDLVRTPAIPFTDKRILCFGISLKNPELHYFTELPTKADDTDLYWTAGNYEEASLIFSAIETRQPSFTESYSAAVERLTFRIVDSDNNKRLEITQTAEESDDTPGTFDFDFSVRLGNETLGRFKLQTLSNGILQNEREVFIYNRFEYGDLFGIFELELDENLNYTTPYSALVEMDASTALWKYEIELTRNLGAGTIEIVDVDAGPITFSETSALASYDKGNIVVFEASAPITRTESGYKNYKLDVDTAELSMTLEALPNPSNHNANSIIYLKL